MRKMDKKYFKSFWAHTREEEKKSLIKFFEFTKTHFKEISEIKDLSLCTI